MLKVMTIVGTRPELIKMSCVIAEFDRHTQHILVHTGQNYDYELNQVFFDDLGIRKPDYFLEAAGENAAQTIGQVIMKADEVMEKEHAIKMEYWGGYSRHNEIWRKVFDVVTDEVVDEEFVTANHAIMMYQPLLESLGTPS